MYDTSIGGKRENQDVEKREKPDKEQGIADPRCLQAY
jgi:hypothetical protein